MAFHEVELTPEAPVPTRAVQAGFALALAILLAIGAVSYQSIRNLLASEAVVFHAQEVRQNLDIILVEVLEAESAARGYLVAGQEFYLEPYHTALQKVDRTLGELELLIAGDPKQRELLNTLRGPIAEKLAHHSRMIERRKEQGMQAGLQFFFTGRGHALMDQIRSQVEGMKENEHLLLSAWLERTHRSAERSLLTLAFGTLLGFGILAAVYYHLNREVGRRKLSEQKVLRWNRFYAVLSKVSQAIVHLRERDALLDAVCRIGVESNLVRMAWIGLMDWGTGYIVPAASAGVDEGYLGHIRITLKETPEGQGPTGRALREGRHFVCRDIAVDPQLLPWRNEALARGYRSSASFPVRIEGNVIGAFTLYAGDSDFFDTQIVALLDEVTADLSFALETMERDRRRREAERALEHQAQIIRQVHDSIISTDLSGYITSWNPGAETLTGFSAEEAIGKHISILYSPEDRQFLEEKIIAPLKTSGSHEAITRMYRKSGEEVLAHLSLSLLRDEHGEAMGMIGYSMDITKSNRAEQALRESEERFRQMAENIEEMFWITDADLSSILYVSPVYERILGRPCRELYDNPWSFLDAVHPADQERVRTGVEEALRGSEWNQQYRIVRPDGSVRWVWDRAFPVRDSQGRLWRFAGITQDITERKEAEEQIRKLNADLERRVAERTEELARVNGELELRNQEVERTNRMKSEFVAHMSHELRTPLNAIIGYSDLLGEEPAGPLHPTYRRFVGNVREGARHLLQIVNDVLDLSKIDAGRIDLHRENLSATEALSEVLSVITPLAQIKSIAIENRVLEDVNIHADRIRFKQILYNLLSNAVKFTPEGGRVWITTCMREGALCFCVHDTGIGIAAEELAGIFDEFRQASVAPGAVKEGTGLGLSITRRLTELHGGTIAVESTPEKGSCFFFSLGPDSMDGPAPAGAADADAVGI